MTPAELAALAKHRLGEEGFDLIGICSAEEPVTADAYDSWLAKGYHGQMAYLERHSQLKKNPRLLLPGARSVIMVGLNYAQSGEHRSGQPRVATYALGRDYHGVIRGKLKRVAKALQQEASAAQFRICIDSAPLLERELAVRAGLGWIGKNTMLIDSRRGSWFLLGAMLTTLDLPFDAPAIGGCGNCRTCIDACPTGCIVFEDDRWQIDARRCISYLTIEHKGPIDAALSGMVGDWTFGCDVCQAVCPFNQRRSSQPQRAQTTREPAFLERRHLPSLSESMGLTDAAWDALSIGSPIRRAKLAGWQRNVAVNLANAGKGRDGGLKIVGTEDTVATEEIDARRSDPQIGSHASENRCDKPAGR